MLAKTTDNVRLYFFGLALLAALQVAHGHLQPLWGLVLVQEQSHLAHMTYHFTLFAQ